MSQRLVWKNAPTLDESFPREMRLNLAVGFLGISLNLFVALFLIHHFRIHYSWAYLAGTLSNVLVSTGLRLLLLKRLIESLNIRYAKLLGLYLFLSWANLGLLCFVIEGFGWRVIPSMVATTLATSVFNYIFVGLWAFVCFPIQEVAYEELSGEFFDDMVDETKVGKFRAWVHQSRFRMTRDFVKKRYLPSKTIVDFAAGSCGWNTEGLPVTGLDVNEKMLAYGIQKGRLRDYQVADMYQSPFPDCSADLIVSSQVFEHLNEPQRALKEIRRVLKQGGTLIIDVPYDLFMGPHFLLFNVHCFIEGYLKGKELYKQRCGHLNHFTLKTLSRLLESEGFVIEKKSLCNFLTIHVAARKNE